jgi:hypothetical protein
MAAEGVEFGSNGDGAKSIPVKIVARSAQPIEHWAFGRIVHDLGGVRHKPKVTIDYAHDENQILGYANRFNTTPRGLELSGVLVPFGNSEADRSREVVHKAANGVEYQASIFWGLDDAVFQFVADNEVAPVNGYDFQGPGLIVRQWSLFGVAICPYGADANTSTEFALALAGKDRDRQITVNILDIPAGARRFVATEPTVQPPEAIMPTEQLEIPVLETAPAAETPVTTAEHEEPADELEQAVEAAATPTPIVPAAPAAETPAAETPAAEEKPATPPAQMTPEAAREARAAEGKRFVGEFGADLGPKYFTEGLSFEAACDRCRADMGVEIEQLKARLAKFAGGCETPPTFDPAEKGSLKPGSPGRDELAERVGPGVAQYVRAMKGQGQGEAKQ